MNIATGKTVKKSGACVSTIINKYGIALGDKQVKAVITGD